MQPSINNLDLGLFENLASQEAPGTATRTTPKRKPLVADQLVEITPEKTKQNLEKLKKRAEEAVKRSEFQIEQRVLQAVLPLWDDARRGIPNPFIRSGLFTVGSSENRDYLKDSTISSLSTYNITYTGSELQQDDLSIWMSLINLARERPMSDAIFFTGYQIVKDCGWSMNSISYKRVQESIERLKVTGLKISSKNHEAAYSGSLIRDYCWAEKDENGADKWMIRFEPRISMLFLEDTTTLLEWEERKTIGSRAKLALWLHSFYSSHREPIPNSIPKIHEMCRSRDSLSSFRRNLRNALATLVEKQIFLSFDISNDMVIVRKNPARLIVNNTKIKKLKQV